MKPQSNFAGYTEPKRQMRRLPVADPISDAQMASSQVDLRFILDEVTARYASDLLTHTVARAYLASRGLDQVELITGFKLGYCAGRLGGSLSEAQKTELTRLGILKSSGAEHLMGCIVFPLLDNAGHVVGFCGRHVSTNSEPAHLYLSGPHQGLLNRKAAKVYNEELILTEGVIDALSLIAIGIRNAIPCYGVNGFTEEHAKLLHDERVKTVAIGFDCDEADRRVCESLAEHLVSEGFGVKLLTPPAGKDWNEALLAGITREEVREMLSKAVVRQRNSLQDIDREKWTPFQDASSREDENLRGLLAEFLASYKAQGRSQQALIGLRSRVPRLFAYLDVTSLDLLALKARDAQGYIGWLSARRSERSETPLCARTVAAYVGAASSFYEYLKHRGLVSSNPFRETKRVRPGTKIPRGLLKETEMEVLLDELERFDESPHLKAAITRYKMHVAAELMYSTGLRVSEVASLRLADVDFGRSMISVQGAKGGYQRVAFMGEFAREILRLYVEKLRVLVSSEWNRRNETLLFGTAWSTFGKILNSELARACASHSLPQMRSHGFRHALGYHLLRAGCNIRYIQSILGHRRLRNTEIYTKVENEDLKHVVDACHPRHEWRQT